MCGIAGIISYEHKIDQNILSGMISTLKHRGPDKQNTDIISKDGFNIGLAHSRLSIIDLSDAASQPMKYRQYTIVFNGEIYNFQEIRKELEKLGHVFQTQSDTEVVLHSFDQWKENAVHKFIGMFAFVLVDQLDKKVYFYRDRAGVKPFYYYWDSKSFIFGSELKAILQNPDFTKQINDIAVGYYFKLGYIPSPQTIYENTYKLNPGHFGIFDLSKKEILIQQYWNPIDFYQKPKLNLDYKEAKSELTQLLLSSCKYRMVADVPLGSFLSGGFDSTAVAAILQKNSKERLKTFTIGFEEGNNEAPYAAQIAKFLGTEHYEYYCTTKEAQELIPQLPFFFDEPFSDSSAIPTLLVSKFARSKVKVALSADGGDELFAGYESYRSLLRNAKLLEKLKFVDNKFSGHLLMLCSQLLNREDFLTHRIYYLGKLLVQDERFRFSSLHEGAQSTFIKIFNRLVPSLSYPDNLMNISNMNIKDPISVGQLVDYILVFPNDLLTKVDRASMAVSLEGREPLVDHRLFEFVAQLPVEFKFDGVTSKKILKDIVYEYIPKELMDRPKTGFSLPISNWLRNDLSYLIEEYLNEKSIKDSGYMDSKYVTHLVHSFKKEKNPYRPYFEK